VKLKDETTNLKKIEPDALQGSVLGHTSDLPASDNTTIAAFADDIPILATHEEPAIVSVSKPPSIRSTAGQRNGELK
jgi:hypothetical protein